MCPEQLLQLLPDQVAPQFLVQQANLYPGQVTLVALGPLTKIALIYGDPDVADIVFTSGADILAVDINVTHQVILTDADRGKLAQSKGKLAQYLCKILDVYFSYHREAYNTTGVYLHDPTTLLAVVGPSLMTYTEGVVRVQTNGITRGLTLFYNTQKRFAEVTEWSNMHENLEAVWMRIQDSYRYSHDVLLYCIMNGR